MQIVPDHSPQFSIEPEGFTAESISKDTIVRHCCAHEQSEHQKSPNYSSVNIAGSRKEDFSAINRYYQRRFNSFK